MAANTAPYRYFSFSPSSGEYQDTATATINLTLKLYDTSWTGKINEVDGVGLTFYNSVGDEVGHTSNSGFMTVTFTGTTIKFVINLGACSDDIKTSAASFSIDGYVSVTTKVGVNEATVYDVLIADENVEKPKYSLIHYTACREPTAPTLDTTLSREPVRLSWGAGSGGTNNSVTGYDVQRRASTDGSSWGSWEDVPDSPVTATEMNVSPPDTAGNYYQFRVRTRGSAGINYFSNWVTGEAGRTILRCDHEPLAGFTDNPLTAGISPVKALHMQELQSRVNTLRTFYGLGTYNFTTITAGATSLAGWTTHVNQIRTAIEEVCSASGKTHEDWISFSVNCPRADIIQQLRNVILAL